MDTREHGKSRPLAIAVSTFALSLGSVLPATAGPEPFVYDALGDSYAGGFGLPETADCAQSDLAYPHVLDGRMKIALDDFAACSGATVQSMLATQLGALDEDTDLVTITIGGNDIGWVPTITTCLVADDEACTQAVGVSSALISGVLPGLLDAAYTQVELAAPDAHVVVIGYPRLFSPEYGAYTVPVSPTFALEASVPEQQLMNDGADLLNATIRTAAEAHGFQFVDVTGRFVDHGVNAPDNWIGGVGDAALFHPTADGQHAYGVALRSSIKPPDLR